MSENTILFALYRMGYRGRATGHGFHATASTILNEQGWDADVIERQLAHKEANKVRAAYHYSKYLAERKKLMQAWADSLDAKERAGEKIVSIQRTTARSLFSGDMRTSPRCERDCWRRIGGRCDLTGVKKLIQFE